MPSAAVDRPESDQPSSSDARSKARVHVDLGTAYAEGERLGVALDEARIAVAYDRTYAPGHMLLGKVYALLDQQSQAAMAFEEAVRLAPGDPEINNEYGWYLCSRGKNKEGIARLEQAARNPYYRTPAQAWANLGLCNIQIANDVAAEEAFLRAYALDPGNMRTVYQLANISYRKGSLARAREFVSELNKNLGEAGTPESLWLAIRIEHKLGNRVAEQKLGNQLSRQFPASDEYQSYLQGKFE